MQLDVNTILVLITCVISVLAFNNPMIAPKYMHRPVDEWNSKEYYRLISHGFLHADFIHLAFNMLALWSFGGVVMQFFYYLFPGFGVTAYVLFYLAAIVVSALPSFFKHRNNYVYSALGASGGTSAIVFTYILFAPWSKIYIYFIPIPAVVGGVAYLIYSSWAGRNSHDNIAHDAHFAGAIFGFVVPIVLKPELLASFIAKVMDGF
jgi:membrane associated rhomboid family serine protease